MSTTIASQSQVSPRRNARASARLARRHPEESRRDPLLGRVDVHERDLQRAGSPLARGHPGRPEEQHPRLARLAQGPFDPLGVVPASRFRVVARGALTGDLEHAADILEPDDPVLCVGIPFDVLGRLDPQV